MKFRSALRAIEQPHDPLAEDDFSIGGDLAEQLGDSILAHGPSVDIVAMAAAGGGVKSWVDVIGADLKG